MEPTSRDVCVDLHILDPRWSRRKLSVPVTADLNRVLAAYYLLVSTGQVLRSLSPPGSEGDSEYERAVQEFVDNQVATHYFRISGVQHLFPRRDQVATTLAELNISATSLMIEVRVGAPPGGMPPNCNATRFDVHPSASSSSMGAPPSFTTLALANRPSVRRLQIMWQTRCFSPNRCCFVIDNQFGTIRSYLPLPLEAAVPCLLPYALPAEFILLRSLSRYFLEYVCGQPVAAFCRTQLRRTGILNRLRLEYSTVSHPYSYFGVITPPLRGLLPPSGRPAQLPTLIGLKFPYVGKVMFALLSRLAYLLRTWATPRYFRDTVFLRPRDPITGRPLSPRSGLRPLYHTEPHDNPFFEHVERGRCRRFGFSSLLDDLDTIHSPLTFPSKAVVVLTLPEIQVSLASFLQLVDLARYSAVAVEYSHHLLPYFPCTFYYLLFLLKFDPYFARAQFFEYGAFESILDSLPHPPVIPPWTRGPVRRMQHRQAQMEYTQMRAATLWQAAHQLAHRLIVSQIDSPVSYFECLFPLYVPGSSASRCWGREWDVVEGYCIRPPLPPVIRERAPQSWDYDASFPTGEDLRVDVIFPHAGRPGFTTLLEYVMAFDDFMRGSRHHGAYPRPVTSYSASSSSSDVIMEDAQSDGSMDALSLPEVSSPHLLLMHLYPRAFGMALVLLTLLGAIPPAACQLACLPLYRFYVPSRHSPRVATYLWSLSSRLRNRLCHIVHGNTPSSGAQAFAAMMERNGSQVQKCLTPGCWRKKYKCYTHCCTFCIEHAGTRHMRICDERHCQMLPMSVRQLHEASLAAASLGHLPQPPPPPPRPRQGSSASSSSAPAPNAICETGSARLSQPAPSVPLASHTRQGKSSNCSVRSGFWATQSGQPSGSPRTPSPIPRPVSPLRYSIAPEIEPYLLWIPEEPVPTAYHTLERQYYMASPDGAPGGEWREHSMQPVGATVEMSGPYATVPLDDLPWGRTCHCYCCKTPQHPSPRAQQAWKSAIRLAWRCLQQTTGALHICPRCGSSCCYECRFGYSDETTESCHMCYAEQAIWRKHHLTLPYRFDLLAFAMTDTVQDSGIHPDAMLNFYAYTPPATHDHFLTVEAWRRLTTVWFDPANVFIQIHHAEEVPGEVFTLVNEDIPASRIGQYLSAMVDPAPQSSAYTYISALFGPIYYQAERGGVPRWFRTKEGVHCTIGKFPVITPSFLQTLRGRLTELIATFWRLRCNPMARPHTRELLRLRRVHIRRHMCDPVFDLPATSPAWQQSYFDVGENWQDVSLSALTPQTIRAVVSHHRRLDFSDRTIGLSRHPHYPGPREEIYQGDFIAGSRNDLSRTILLDGNPSETGGRPYEEHLVALCVRDSTHFEDIYQLESSIQSFLGYTHWNPQSLSRLSLRDTFIDPLSEYSALSYYIKKHLKSSGITHMTEKKVYLKDDAHNHISPPCGWNGVPAFAVDLLLDDDVQPWLPRACFAWNSLLATQHGPIRAIDVTLATSLLSFDGEPVSPTVVSHVGVVPLIMLHPSLRVTPSHHVCAGTHHFLASYLGPSTSCDLAIYIATPCPILSPGGWTTRCPVYTAPSQRCRIEQPLSDLRSTIFCYSCNTRELLWWPPAKKRNKLQHSYCGNTQGQDARYQGRHVYVGPPFPETFSALHAMGRYLYPDEFLSLIVSAQRFYRVCPLVYRREYYQLLRRYEQQRQSTLACIANDLRLFSDPWMVNSVATPASYSHLKHGADLPPIEPASVRVARLRLFMESSISHLLRMWRYCGMPRPSSTIEDPTPSWDHWYYPRIPSAATLVIPIRSRARVYQQTCPSGQMQTPIVYRQVFPSGQLIHIVEGIQFTLLSCLHILDMVQLSATRSSYCAVAAKYLPLALAQARRYRMQGIFNDLLPPDYVAFIWRSFPDFMAVEATSAQAYIYNRFRLFDAIPWRRSVLWDRAFHRGCTLEDQIGRTAKLLPQPKRRSVRNQVPRCPLRRHATRTPLRLLYPPTSLLLPQRYHLDWDGVLVVFVSPTLAPPSVLLAAFASIYFERIPVRWLHTARILAGPRLLTTGFVRDTFLRIRNYPLVGGMPTGQGSKVHPAMHAKILEAVRTHCRATFDPAALHRYLDSLDDVTSGTLAQKVANFGVSQRLSQAVVTMTQKDKIDLFTFPPKKARPPARAPWVELVVDLAPFAFAPALEPPIPLCQFAVSERTTRTPGIVFALKNTVADWLCEPALVAQAALVPGVTASQVAATFPSAKDVRATFIDGILVQDNVEQATITKPALLVQLGPAEAVIQYTRPTPTCDVRVKPQTTMLAQFAESIIGQRRWAVIVQNPLATISSQIRAITGGVTIDNLRSIGIKNGVARAILLVPDSQVIQLLRLSGTEGCFFHLTEKEGTYAHISVKPEGARYIKRCDLLYSDAQGYPGFLGLSMKFPLSAPDPVVAIRVDASGAADVRTHFSPTDSRITSFNKGLVPTSFWKVAGVHPSVDGPALQHALYNSASWPTIAYRSFIMPGQQPRAQLRTWVVGAAANSPIQALFFPDSPPAVITKDEPKAPEITPARPSAPQPDRPPLAHLPSPAPTPERPAPSPPGDPWATHEALSARRRLFPGSPATLSTGRPSRWDQLPADPVEQLRQEINLKLTQQETRLQQGMHDLRTQVGLDAANVQHSLHHMSAAIANLANTLPGAPALPAATFPPLPPGGVPLAGLAARSSLEPSILPQATFTAPIIDQAALLCLQGATASGPNAQGMAGALAAADVSTPGGAIMSSRVAAAVAAATAAPSRPAVSPDVAGSSSTRPAAAFPTLHPNGHVCFEDDVRSRPGAPAPHRQWANTCPMETDGSQDGTSPANSHCGEGHTPLRDDNTPAMATYAKEVIKDKKSKKNKREKKLAAQLAAQTQG